MISYVSVMIDKLPVLQDVPDFEKHLAEAAWFSSCGYLVISNEGIVLAANEHVCRLLNYTEGELRGMHFKDFTLSRDQTADAAEFAALIRGEKSHYHMDKTWIGKLNNPVSGHLYVRRFETGEVVFAISQVIEGLSPEQVGAFAVMVRSLMEDWLMTQGLKMSKKPDGGGGEKVWYKQPIVWAALAGAGGAWPILTWLVSFIRRIADVLYPAGP